LFLVGITEQTKFDCGFSNLKKGKYNKSKLVY